MQAAPSVSGSPKYLLRAEGLVVLGLVVVLFWRGGYSWVLFVVLFLFCLPLSDCSLTSRFASPSPSSGLRTSASIECRATG